ncbi:SRPBCC domain-containing protein [Ruania halotolerans]|uniref:SRPBCC domain-containing protein n=1 Tax=Ruania halotolerans TaxID=2897773 RepID=UPI001E3F2374|nr:SRPBCC domain-containing protein [Ruania halotolerans]UFU07735.1 SRPBCC domain-containing protein [Ruania halotolerans]
MSDIEVTVPLAADAAHAFSVYVAGLWWPPAWSEDPERFERLVLQPRVGGRVLARYTGGREDDWGEVLDYQPGRRLQHTYAHASGVPSLITAEFVDRDEGGSDLHFRHGGWTAENDQDRPMAAVWADQLDVFAEMSERDPRPPRTPPD